MNTPKLKWKRDSKATGLSAIGSPAHRRGWTLYQGDKMVAFISHSQAHALSAADRPYWKVWYAIPGRTNIQLKKEFATDDEAKPWVVAMLPKVLEKFSVNPEKKS